MPATRVHSPERLPAMVSRAVVERAIKRMTAGGENAAIYWADSTERDVLLQTVVRLSDRIYPGDTRFPDNVDPDDDRFHAARIALEFDYTDRGPVAPARQALSNRIHELLLAIDRVDSDTQNGGVRVRRVDDARRAWCALWPAVLEWVAEADDA